MRTFVEQLVTQKRINAHLRKDSNNRPFDLIVACAFLVYDIYAVVYGLEVSVDLLQPTPRHEIFRKFVERFSAR